MGLNNSFSAVMNNKLSRGFGGSIAGVADPYVSGYHFISFTNLSTACLNSSHSSNSVFFIIIINYLKATFSTAQNFHY